MIIVTGTPGVGKTTFAKALAEKEGRSYVCLTALCDEYGLLSEWDEKRQCFVVDSVSLVDIVLKYADEDAVVDGHLSHELPSSVVSACYVVKCPLDLLKKRLEVRGYSPEKIRENLDCEIFDVCYCEALENGHSPIVVSSQ